MFVAWEVLQALRFKVWREKLHKDQVWGFAPKCVLGIFRSTFLHVMA